jgi:hypothetical protein
VELANRIEGATDDDGISSAETALHMLTFPFRQEFGEPSDDDDSTFVATYPHALLQLTHSVESL